MAVGKYGLLGSLVFTILSSIVLRVLYYSGVYLLTIKGVSEAWEVLRQQVLHLQTDSPAVLTDVWAEVLQLISIAGIDQAVNMVMGAYGAYFGLAGLVFARGWMMRGSLPGGLGQ